MHKSEDELKSLGIIKLSLHTFSLFSTREEVALSQGVPDSREKYLRPDYFGFRWYCDWYGKIGKDLGRVS
tara:strand:- start:225 stop:434 length:210 start_codon:yes stop_codon:yes gene_type:complete